MTDLEKAMVADLIRELAPAVTRLVYAVMHWTSARHCADAPLMGAIAPLVLARAGVIREALLGRPSSVVEGLIARLTAAHRTPSLGDMLRLCLAGRPDLGALGDLEVARAAERKVRGS